MTLRFKTDFVVTLFFVIATQAICQQPVRPGTGSQVAPAHAQITAGKSGTYTLQINPKLVVIDVVVTDKQGHVVDNLTSKDFRVYEDKIPQTIHSFEAHRSSPSPAVLSVNSTAELDHLEPEAPVSIIVLDELNTKFEDEAFARYSLKRYLDSQGDTLLQPTMLVAADFEHLMVLHDYTTSKQEILAALDHHLAENPWRSQNGSFMSDQLNADLTSLTEIAQATAGHPGHKNMIWIGKGFPPIDPVEMTAVDAASIDAAVQTCTNLLRDSRVTLYSIDPAGLSVEEPPQDEDGFDVDDPFGGEFDFNTMAAATGGEAFFGRNDVDKLIGASVQAGVNFYTLSYLPSDPNDTKAFRNITVRMKDPQLLATTRAGYYVVSPPLPPAINAAGKSSDRLIFDLSVAGSSLMVYDGVPFTMNRDPSLPNRFALNIGSQNIEWDTAGPGMLSTDVSLLVESFDRKGKMLNHLATIITRHMPTPLAKAAPDASGFTLHVDVPTQPPAARLRFVVRINSTGKIGAQNFYLIDKKLISDPVTGLSYRHGRH